MPLTNAKAATTAITTTAATLGSTIRSHPAEGEPDRSGKLAVADAAKSARNGCWRASTWKASPRRSSSGGRSGAIGLALLSQRDPKASQGSVETGLGSTQADPQRIGDIGHPEVGRIAQTQDGPVVGGNEPMATSSVMCSAAATDGSAAGAASGSRITSRAWYPRRAWSMAARDSDPPEPRCPPGRIAKLWQALPGAERRLLQGILGIGWDRSTANARDRRSVHRVRAAVRTPFDPPPGRPRPTHRAPRQGARAPPPQGSRRSRARVSLPCPLTVGNSLTIRSIEFFI